MALGFLLWCPNRGARPEVVGDAGVLAEDGSAEAIAVAIRHLLDNPDLEKQLQSVGPQRAHRFSWPDHAKTVLGIYKQILSVHS